MALLVPDVGEVACLDMMLKQSDEDYTLQLYNTDITPAEGDVAGDYTPSVANFTNYVSKALTRAGWPGASTSGGVTSSSYAQQTWTCGASGNTIYGYWVVNAVTGTLLWAEKFASAKILADTDVLNLTPVMELA